MIQTGKQSMIIRKAVRPSQVEDSYASGVLQCAHPTCCKCQKASSCLISCILRACAAWRRCAGGRCNLWGVEVIRQRNVNAAVAQIRKRKRPVAEELALPAQVPLLHVHGPHVRRQRNPELATRKDGLGGREWILICICIPATSRV